MKMGRPLIGALWLLIFCAAAANAQDIAVNLDPAQTQIHFTLGATLHTVHGTFQLKSGNVAFDAARGKTSGEIVIDATSGNTENSGRDHKMHEDVLESAVYPEIVFVPQQIDGHIALDGTSQAQIRGVIRIHGSEQPFTVPVASEIHQGKLKATLDFEIPYVKWGLKDPSTFVLRVDKIVKIEITAVGDVSQTSGLQ